MKTKKGRAKSISDAPAPELKFDTVIAYDCSGSTAHQVFYHQTSQDIVQNTLKYVSAHPKVLMWDNCVKEVSLEHLEDVNKNRNGFGGTEPQSVARFCVEKQFHGKLIFITDGEISGSSVRGADQILQDWTFERVDCHLIQSSGEPNLSCSCPFTRNSPHMVYSHNQLRGESWKKCTGVSDDELKILEQFDSISTVDKFIEVSNVLERIVIAKTMGTNGNVELRNKLLEMKQRIVKNTAKEEGKSKNWSRRLANALSDEKNTEEALYVAQEMVTSYFSQDVEWSKKLSAMISMTEGAIRDAFGQSAISNRLDRANQIEISEAKDAPSQVEEPGDAIKQAQFVCPISYDEEHDVVLLIADGKPILPELEKFELDDLLNCPLNAFKYPHVIDALLQRLDHPIGLSTFKDSKGGLKTSPFTRKPIVGGFVLGACTEHVIATNWTLTKILSDGKACGNPDLWFAVIWMLAKSKLEYLKEVVPIMQDQMVWRLSNSSSFASLCGLPEFVTTRVKLGTALWFVLASPFLKIPAAADPLRYHISHLDSMKQVFALTGMKLPDGAEKCHDRLDALLRLLGMSKKMPFASFKSKIRALHQCAYRLKEDNLDEKVASTETVVSWIALDGPASDKQVASVLAELPAVFSRLSIQEIAGLASLVNPNLSASAIVLASDWVAPQTPAPVVEWAYGIEEFKVPAIDVCLATCRPFSVVDGTSWVECAEESALKLFKENVSVENMLSTYKAFGTFVGKYGKYPSLDELIVFVYNRYVVHGRRSTLPHQTVELISRTQEDFNKTIKTLLPVEAAARFNASVSREKRKVLESPGGDNGGIYLGGLNPHSDKNASYWFG
eukprot:TRINITY_DN5031_c0_g1_i1.p1 TRINITY_DN5031_c0_g1~~TRINITY_DN5031_c0_g1_i1.p1  ORF type:complete len:841 (-),score=220.30 TRINITY_DN5031_c0_g1_i1:2410-4932(-)